MHFFFSLNSLFLFNALAWSSPSVSFFLLAHLVRTKNSNPADEIQGSAVTRFPETDRKTGFMANRSWAATQNVPLVLPSAQVAFSFHHILYMKADIQTGLLACGGGEQLIPHQSTWAREALGFQWLRYMCEQGVV